MNDICFPPNFAEQYLIPYLTELLEAEIENADEIYEFSVHYFQDKVKEKEGSGHVPKIKVASQNISDVERMNCIAPIFCYGSVSKSFPKDSKILHELEDDQNKNINSKIASTPDFENESGFEQNSEHLCRHGIIKQNEPETLQQINEFSFLLSKCISVIDQMENMIRATTASLITTEKPAEVRDLQEFSSTAKQCNSASTQTPIDEKANHKVDELSRKEEENSLLNPNTKLQDIHQVKIVECVHVEERGTMCEDCKLMELNFLALWSGIKIKIKDSIIRLEGNSPLVLKSKIYNSQLKTQSSKNGATFKVKAEDLTGKEENVSCFDILESSNGTASNENIQDFGTPKGLFLHPILKYTPDYEFPNSLFQNQKKENIAGCETRQGLLSNARANTVQNCEAIKKFFENPIEEDLDCGFTKVLLTNRTDENILKTKENINGFQTQKDLTHPVADNIQYHKNMNNIFQEPMEVLDCGTPKILLINEMDENIPVSWIIKDLFQNEIEENLKGYGTQEDLANPVTDNIQDHKSVNDVFQKPMEDLDCGTPKKIEENVPNCGTLKDFLQKKIVENMGKVGIRKDLTNPLSDDIQECENESDVFKDPTEEDLLDCRVKKVLLTNQVEENIPDSETSNSSCKSSMEENLDFITSLDIFQNLIRENILNSQFLRCLLQNHMTPEVINHEVKAKSPKLKYKTATERLKEQLQHLIAVNNTLRHSCQGEETAGSNGSEPNIAPNNKNFVPMTGRNWLRTYCTVQAMKRIKEEDWRALYGAESQAHDLGTPVWILQTNATSPCKTFRSGGFFNGFRAWYFAWGIQAVEEKLHAENSQK